MNLHNDKATFERIISDIHAQTGISPAIIEKDYYVTMFLEVLAKRLPTMIFKGGTSLSKCYHIIKRFSEDIDITVDNTENLTQGQYRKIKQAVVDSVAELKFEIVNIEEIRSRRDFNQYIIDYPAIFSLVGLKQFLFIETAVSVRSFPTESKPIKSIIQEKLEEQGKQNFAAKYDLREFFVCTQKLDRTLIDKIFAIADYYLLGKEVGHSRHLYDIHKLLPAVSIDDDFKELVKEVRVARKVSSYCRSAQDGVNTTLILNEIIEKNIYQKDYEETLVLFLRENVPYSEAIKTLRVIIDKDIF